MLQWLYMHSGGTRVESLAVLAGEIEHCIYEKDIYIIGEI